MIKSTVQIVTIADLTCTHISPPFFRAVFKHIRNFHHHFQGPQYVHTEMGEALLGKNRDSILKVENEGLKYWIKNFFDIAQESGSIHDQEICFD